MVLDDNNAFARSRKVYQGCRFYLEVLPTAHYIMLPEHFSEHWAKVVVRPNTWPSSDAVLHVSLNAPMMMSPLLHAASAQPV